MHFFSEHGVDFTFVKDVFAGVDYIFVICSEEEGWIMPWLEGSSGTMQAF